MNVLISSSVINLIVMFFFVVQAKQVRVSAICDMSDGSPEHLRYELQS